MTEHEKMKARVAYHSRNLELLRTARKVQEQDWQKDRGGAMVKLNTIASGMPTESIGIPAECLAEILKIAEETTSKLLEGCKSEQHN